MKSKIRKISKFVSILETDEGPEYNGRAQALYFHKNHTLVINYDNWDLSDIDYGNLPVNQFKRADTDRFYDLIEKYSEKNMKKPNRETVSSLRQIIREEIRTELQIFKKEIIAEIRRTSNPILEQTKSEPIKPKIQQRPIISQKPKPKRQYSADPLINSILESTDPVDSDPMEVFYEQPQRSSGEFDFLIEEHNDNLYIPNIEKPISKPAIIPTVGPEGEVINTNNTTVRKVLNVMNTDFSAKLKAMEAAAKNMRPQ